MDVTLRTMTPDDLPFLYRVYASTREDELAVLDWSDTEREAFLAMQFDAQHRFYQEQFPNAAYQLVLSGKAPIGRLYLDHRADEIRIIDIALLTEYRGQGTGSALMRDILADGQRRRVPVRIHVERNNPALRLYHRLGFREVGDQGVYLLMEWQPETGTSQ